MHYGIDMNMATITGQEREEDVTCPSLTYKQRIIGFILCLSLGGLFSIVSFVTLFQENYTFFAILNTLSNVMAIGSTFFLAGPKKQLKNMFAKTRIVATIVYLVMMVLTFVVALVVKIGWLTVICVIIQYFAMLWYDISYIPFARDAVIRVAQAPFR
eukprot:Tbor_TRINITY_DN5764_c0_g1::TRINITY_DN5764_c0_g1_i1::g.20271::m.20271